MSVSPFLTDAELHAALRSAANTVRTTSESGGVPRMQDVYELVRLADEIYKRVVPDAASETRDKLRRALQFVDQVAVILDDVDPDVDLKSVSKALMHIAGQIAFALVTL